MKNNNNFDLPQQPVDKIFAVGAPITLNAKTKFTDLASASGHHGVENMQDKKHVYLSDYLHPLLFDAGIDIGSDLATWLLISSILDEHPLSQNTMRLYHDLAVNRMNGVDLSDVKVNKLYLMYTSPTDLIVPYEDAEIVYYQTELIDEENKEIVNELDRTFWNTIKNPLLYWHSSQTTNEDFLDKIIERLEE